MARIKLAKCLYGLAILSMPLSYALKDAFTLNIIWVNPTLILATAAFLLIGAPKKQQPTVWLLAFAFLSASIGLLLMSPSGDRGRGELYVGYMEPIRLTLNMMWFWMSMRFLRDEKTFVLRLVTGTVVWEFVVAVYLELALYGIAPAPEALKLYLSLFSTRQSVVWGSFARMGGTFLESPPFGLFMFCCLTILGLALLSSEHRNDFQLRRWLKVGIVCAAAGCIGSFSDQVFIAIGIVGLMYAYAQAGGGRIVRTTLLAMLAIIICIYLIDVMSIKHGDEAQYSGDPQGTSIGEREFHSEYALGLLSEQPFSILTGIGPGRYGDYAVRTGYFPSTVTPQVTIIEWLVGYGIFGALLIAMWLCRIGSQSLATYGTLGLGILIALIVANMFQANWLWESWFLALAFLATANGTDLVFRRQLA